MYKRHLRRYNPYYSSNPDSVEDLRSVLEKFEGGDQLQHDILDGWSPAAKRRWRRRNLRNPDSLPEFREAMADFEGGDGITNQILNGWTPPNYRRNPECAAECGEPAVCNNCKFCQACCRCQDTICHCGRTITCDLCVSCPQCCICRMPVAARYSRNPEGSSKSPIPQSTKDVFGDIEKILELVKLHEYRVPLEARLKIAQRLLQLGYILADIKD